MKARWLNATACLLLWLVAALLLNLFIDWTAARFALNTMAVYVLVFLGGLMLGAIAGYVYVELEALRMRLEREHRDRALRESDEQFSQWLRDHGGTR